MEYFKKSELAFNTHYDSSSEVSLTKRLVPKLSENVVNNYTIQFNTQMYDNYQDNSSTINGDVQKTSRFLCVSPCRHNP